MAEILPMERRRTLFIAKRFQAQFLIVLVIGSLSAAFFGFFILSVLVWKEFGTEQALAIVSHAELSDILAKQAALLSVSFVAGFLLVLFFLSFIVLVLSHRIAGPLYAIGRRMQECVAGDWVHGLKVRKTDALHDLTEEMNHLLEKQRAQWRKELERLKEASFLMEEVIVELKQKLSMEERSMLEQIEHSTYELVRKLERIT